MRICKQKQGRTTASDTSEKRLRMRSYRNVFLEFKKVLVRKEMLRVYISSVYFCGTKIFFINEDIMKELALSFKN
jgi:hypothetical protein